MSANRDFQRLHKRKDIVRVFRHGSRVRGDALDLVCLRGEEEGLRIAVVVPLFGHRAVDRNLVKRRMKEALRTGGFLRDVRGDYVVRANRAAYGRGYDEIARELRLAFAGGERPAGGTEENDG
jgi:ribonuclease P protein component